MSPEGRPYSAVRRPWFIDPVPSCYNGDWQYFGRPDLCGSRYNGGNFGPGWTRIGSIWNRGRLSYCLKTARVYPFAGNGGSWRKAVLEVWMLESRWLPLAGPSPNFLLMDWTAYIMSANPEACRNDNSELPNGASVAKLWPTIFSRCLLALSKQNWILSLGLHIAL
jgi:hypothetical protein